mmetsp:Transcript_3190/g.6433  ORF Transcript_3190/g.6433 Transcript_3190/m.6433 type:complete len:619 (+) Transcript_3190:54-1910(+)
MKFSSNSNKRRSFFRHWLFFFLLAAVAAAVSGETATATTQEQEPNAKPHVAGTATTPATSTSSLMTTRDDTDSAARPIVDDPLLSPPACSSSLSANFTTFVVVNVNMNANTNANANADPGLDDDVNVDSSNTTSNSNSASIDIDIDIDSTIDRLATLFQDTYNEMIDIRPYTHCDNQYRTITKIQYIVLEDEDDEGENDAGLLSPFLFGNKLHHRVLEKSSSMSLSSLHSAVAEGDDNDNDNDAANIATATATATNKQHNPRRYVRSGIRRRLLQQETDHSSSVLVAGDDETLQLEQEPNNDQHDNISLVFEVTVACRETTFCTGNNAALFARNLDITKSEFSRLYVNNVVHKLVVGASTDASSDIDTSTTNVENEASNSDATNNFKNGNSDMIRNVRQVELENIQEIQEESCPQGNPGVTQFTRPGLLELNVTGGIDDYIDGYDGNYFTVNDSAMNPGLLSLLRRIEIAYVSTYNRLTENNYCDPLFHRLTKVTVLGIGTESPSSSSNTTLSLRLSVEGLCMGCDRLNAFFFADPRVLLQNTTNQTGQERRAMEVELKTEPKSIPGQWQAITEPFTTTGPEDLGRYLQQQQEQEQQEMLLGRRRLHSSQRDWLRCTF